MSLTFYRVQASTFPTEAICDEENQFSYAWNGDESLTRRGISACTSREELATYLAQTGIPFDNTWNLVTFEGSYADEDDVDAELGAVLTIPTAILATESLADGFGAEIIAAFED